MINDMVTSVTNTSSGILNLDELIACDVVDLANDMQAPLNEDSSLLARAQAMAALAERERLARNLHDAINQSLFSANLIAEVLPRLWDRDSEAGREALADLRGLIRGALADVREVLADLHPGIVADADFKDLLNQLGDALTGRTNIAVNIIVDGQGVLPAAVQIELYGLCRETMNNIAKHAGASQVEIRLEYESDRVALSIRDDGCGFDATRVFLLHYGLSIMRQRADAIGATLSIISEPGCGTEVAIRWNGSCQGEAP